MPDYAFEGPKWSTSTITWSFAAAGGDVSNTIGSAYQSTILAALTRWAEVANVTFKQVADSPSADIRIGWGQFAGTQLGETDFSFVNASNQMQMFRAGTEVRLEDPSARPVGTTRSTYYQGTTTTLYQAVLHEIGHALGLAHSSSPADVMFASIGQLDPDLGAGDIQGIRLLYGAAAGSAAPTSTSTSTSQTAVNAPSASATASPAANLIAVYRFFDANSGTQFLTANLAERNSVIATRPDLAYEGLAMGALSSPGGDPNAVPVYRFFDTSNGSHLFTTSATENAQLLATRPDLTSEQPTFYEHATQEAGDSPVYRFFDKSNGSHFYTDNSTEKTQLQSSRADLTLEGIAFYAPTGTPASGIPSAANAAAEAAPTVISISDDTVLIYRVDLADGQQLLTADTSEYSAALGTYPNAVDDGAALGAISPDAGDADAAPVFRFFNPTTGDHLLTASATEAAQLATSRPDLVDEQVAFYEHLTQKDGDVPVYRFFDTATGTHFYTASASEHASILATRPDMTQEGVAFYAPSI